MSDTQIVQLSPQEVVRFVVSSREEMEISIAYLDQVPGTDKASFGVRVRYAGDMENDDVG